MSLPGTYDKDDPEGVRIDTLVDSRVDASSKKSKLEEVYTLLDEVADDQEGVFSGSDRNQIRAMQSNVANLIGRCARTLDSIDEELEVLQSTGGTTQDD